MAPAAAAAAAEEEEEAAEAAAAAGTCARRGEAKETPGRSRLSCARGVASALAPRSSPSHILYLNVMVGVYVAQSICTVDFVKLRTKMPLFGDVSAQTPSASP